MMTSDTSNTADTIDSREILERLAELTDEFREATGDEPDDYSVLTEDDWAFGLGAEGAAEMVALLELNKEGEENAGDWQYGATLIRDTYFEQYARDLAEDIGAVSRDADWPACHIDWEAAADALKVDYHEIDYDGMAYWVRS